jgi:nucleoside-diphosphate kinase
MKIQQTLVLIKPDALQRGLTGEIISRFERKGLKVVALKVLHMDEALAKRHYAIHEGKPFFAQLVEFITSSPVVAIVFEGAEAIEVARRLIGETNPLQASPGTIRGDFGLDVGHNLVHGSDSEENAAAEIKLFFSPEEILSYRREVDKWITEP